MLSLLLVSYVLYISSAIIVSQVIFSSEKSKELSNLFNFLIAFQEFVSLTFMRAKTSIKYYPRIVILISTIFLLHYQTTTFDTYHLTFKLSLTLYLLATLQFLVRVEMPIVEQN